MRIVPERYYHVPQLLGLKKNFDNLVTSRVPFLAGNATKACSRIAMIQLIVARIDTGTHNSEEGKVVCK